MLRLAKSPQQYVTGMPALSVPVDEDLADWHQAAAFSGRKPLPIAGITHPATDHLWGDAGVTNRAQYLRDVGLLNDETREVFVASPARAIADLLFSLIQKRQDPSIICIEHIPLSDASLTELTDLVQKYLEQDQSPTLREWTQKNPAVAQRLTHLV